jgi:predicted secreted hydrolase
MRHHFVEDRFGKVVSDPTFLHRGKVVSDPTSMNRLRRRLLLSPLALLAGRARAVVAYPDVRAGTTLAFPDDEGAHPEFRSEWWYVTGWLRDERREFGFQVTFFRNRPGVAEASTSRFAAKQLLFAHAALADPERRRLVIDQRAAREGFGLASAASHRTDVRIGDWSLEQRGEAYLARVRARTFALELVLDAHTPVLLQGDDGVSRKGPQPLDASYYYSRPQLIVSGLLSLDERTTQVSGVAWLDHEWSSQYLTRGAVGWDWTGINFDDGAALMAFRIRNAKSEPLWAGGAWRDSNGTRRVFAPADVAFTPQSRWRSPRTSIDYPVSFRVRAGDRDVVLEPLFPDQELDARAGVGVVYWEGAVRATAAGGAAGRGYLELTGYGEPLRLGSDTSFHLKTRV